MRMQDALKRDFAQRSLLHRERLIVAWVRVMEIPVNAQEACKHLGLSINPTQITLKSLYERGFLKREKKHLTYYYQVN